jgi:hypothetical protein
MQLLLLLGPIDQRSHLRALYVVLAPLPHTALEAGPNKRNSEQLASVQFAV